MENAREKFYETQNMYKSKQIKRLQGEINELHQQLESEKNFSKLMMFFVVIVTLLAVAGVMAVMWNG